MPLYEETWAGQRMAAERAAVETVRRLDRRVILDPALAGELDKIASHYTLNVATLQPEKIVGKRRPIERSVNDFGHTRSVTFHMMDITIPFEGDASSFRYSPSYCTIPSYRCEVKQSHLLVSMTDDENVQRNLDQFVQQITQNLNALRSEVASWVPHLRTQLEQVAQARKNEISAQTDRDKNLKFKVLD